LLNGFSAKILTSFDLLHFILFGININNLGEGIRYLYHGLVVVSMGRSKAKTLYWIWKKYSESRWKRELRKVGVVTQEDINGFLRLLTERKEDYYFKGVGKFISLVLEECYKGKFIELDVGAINGIIAIGMDLDWDGIIYVKGNVNGNVGCWMKKGVIIIEGSVRKSVGFWMDGGLIIVKGDVDGDVGEFMTGGMIIVDGVIKKRDWLEELGSGGLVVNNGFVYLGRNAR